MEKQTGLEIAIIGMSGRFPGAGNTAEFWENLRSGVESISHFTTEELIAAGIAPETVHHAQYVKANGLLEDKEYFDASFFNYRPDEAKLMDPQLRIFHENVWQALEDAGCDPRAYSGKIGLFAGASCNVNWEVYAQLTNRDGLVDHLSAGQLSNARFLATKIAYNLNLRGPAVFVDTACSTSLVAIHEACKSLLLADCHMAIAGAVSIHNRGKAGYFHQEGMIYSGDGHCRAFDEAASGTVIGEGTAVVVLKTLKNALKDGDHIWAVIKGSAINNDGSYKVGYTAPSVNGQTEAIKRALKWAGVPSSSISYVEAHGTGTRLGDPVEVEALKHAFGKSEDKYCALGSVKTNIGHLDVAAGVAGLIKTVLCLKHRQLPASLHFRTANPEIGFEGSPFYVNNTLRDWHPQNGYPLRAGVSSFGIGGTNAHIILEEAPAPVAGSSSRASHLLLLSGHTPASLQGNIERLKAYLETHENASLADLSYTLQTGRTPLAYRTSVVCSNREEAISQLSGLTPVKEGQGSKVVFMFPGQGTQYAGMCEGLYANEPVFKATADACFEIVKSINGKDLKAIIFSQTREALDETANTQPALFIMEYALSRLLLHWGIEPDLMIGHSIGEYVAACLSGVFKLEDALQLVVKRGELMQSAPRGSMLGVPLSLDAATVLLSEHEGLWLAAVNGPELCTLSGETEAITSSQATLESRGYRCRALQTSHGFHSGLMDTILPDFLSAVQSVELQAPTRRFISNVTGKAITAAQAVDPQYWVDHLRHTVLFSEGIKTLLEEGEAVFVEVGPGKVLSTLAGVHGAGTTVSLLSHGGDTAQLLAGLGKLWESGVVPSWERFYEEEHRLKVSLPTYAFEKVKYPVNVNAWELIGKIPAQNGVTKEPDISKWFYAPSWKLTSTKDNSIVPRKRTALFFAGNNSVINDLLERWNSEEESAVCVHAGTSFREVSPLLYEIRPDQEADYHMLFSTLAAQGRLPDCLVHNWNETPYSLIKALKVWMPSAEVKDRQVILLTSDLFRILDNGETDPVKALPSALLKVLSSEHPTLTTCHIDISLEEKTTQHLYNELQSPASGKVIVLRHGRRWEQIYEPISVKEYLPVLKKGGVYMITGGLGEIGYRMAEKMLRTLDAKVILIGRTKHSSTNQADKKMERLHTLQQCGGEVMYVEADIADVTTLTAAVRTAEKHWGAINGVIHAAGIIGENILKPVVMLNEEDFEQQSRSKIAGLIALDQVTGNKNMDFCLLLSSLSTVLGGAGMGAYAAANAFMDSYIRTAQEQGRLLQWCSLNLDGVAMEKNPQHAIGNEELFEVFQQALSVKKIPQLVVSVSDLQKRMEWIAGQRKLNEGISEPELLAASQSVDIEEQLIMLWQQFFGKTDISPEDDFFQIGGDSLKALTMVARIHKQFAVEVSIRDFFSKPTIRELGNYIRLEKKQTGVPDQYTSIPAAPSLAYYPLSAAQQRMYFLNEFDKETMGYNLVKFYNITGPLQPERLKNAFSKLVERHESLRTYFEMLPEGKLMQKISSSAAPEVAFIRTNEAHVPGILKAFVKPFDLGQAPLFRVGIIELAAEEYILMLDMHHIITDGVSQSVLINDFRALYSNETLPALPLQYKDYAYWQQGTTQQSEIIRQRDFWLRNFANEPVSLQLPLDFPRPSEKRYEGDLMDFTLNEEETTKLREMAAKEGATLFAVLLSVFNVLLGKLSDQEDIVIGTPVAGRSHADLEGIIGLFVNTLAIRSYPDGNLSFSEFLSQVRVTALSSLDNQLYQYEDLIDDLKIERGTNRNPLFDILFSYLNFEDHALTLPGLTLTTYQQQQVRSRFDLTLYVSEQPAGILLRFQYATALFKRETIERFIGYFKNIISAIVTDSSVKLSDIDMLPEEEKQQLLFSFNDTYVSLPSLTVTDLFREQVRRQPDHIAVVCGALNLSYQELEERSNAVAAAVSRKIQPPGIVAIYTEPGIEMICGMLGILKAGCSFLPLDAAHHQARQETVLQESGCRLLLTSKHLLKKLRFEGEELVVENITENISENIPADVETKADAPAYVIYTSGSTGTPKGVVINNANLANYARWLGGFIKLGPDDRSVLTSSFAFDLGYSSIFPVITSGGSLHIVPKTVYQSPEILLDYIAEQGITFLKITPSLFRVITDASSFADNTLNSVRTILLGGEAINTDDLKKAKQTYEGLQFINHYGPTETTIGTVATFINDVDAFSLRPVIGKPIDNARAFILDRHGRLLPRGTAGELVIGGAGVGRGYLENDMLTNEKFITTSLHPGKVYRTGDLVRWTPEGDIEFLGRIDSQVKIRGYRVEPGEVERRLAAHEHIKEVVVLPKERDGAKYLVAYYVASEKIASATLSHFLAETLPDYMVPSYYVHLASLPLTPNGKLNRKELPDHTPDTEEVVLAAANEIEEKLVEIWSKVLGLERIGVTTNFFLSGGDSIKSIQITARMRSAGYKMAVNDIFTHQTIRELSQKVTTLAVIAEQTAVSGTVELSPVQRWFFNTYPLYRHHYNQSVMLHFPEGLSATAAKNIFRKIQQHHDALRMIFREENGVMVQRNLPEDVPLVLAEYDLSDLKDPEEPMLLHCNTIQSGIDLAKGPLIKLGLFHLQEGSHLLIVVHHLAVDGVSWRILLEDLETLHRQEKDKEPLVLPLKTDSFQGWAKYMQEYAVSSAFREQADYWAALPGGNNGYIKRDMPEGMNRVKDCERASFELPAELTSKLLSTAHAAFNTQINDLLLAALLLTVKRQYACNALRIDMEGHGRQTSHEILDFNRTVGWFTSIYPVLLTSDTVVLKDLIRQVKENLRGIPGNGIGYLLHRYMQPAASTTTTNGTRIRFNYLGQFNAVVKEGQFRITTGPLGTEVAPDMPRAYEWDLSGIVMNDVLEMTLTYSGLQYNASGTDAFMQTYRECLITVIDYCSSRNEVLLSPADLSFKALPGTLLDVWQQQYMIEDIYPLSPMQESMLFHSLLDTSSKSYFEQKTLRLKGRLDIPAMERGLKDLVARYDILRTVFLHNSYSRPLQLVLKQREAIFDCIDVRDECAKSSREGVIQSYQVIDRTKTFDLSKDPLLRVTLLQTGEDEFEYIWSYHHILMDGWCAGIVWNDFKSLYNIHSMNAGITLPPVRKYANYITWLENRGKAVSRDFWSNYLSGYEQLATLPGKEAAPRGRAVHNLRSAQLIIDQRQTEALLNVAVEYKVTINTILSCAWAILLARYNNTDDVVFGAVVSGRPAEIEGVETMIGLFINTVPVRINYGPEDTLADLLQRAQQQAIASEPHHYNLLSEVQALNELGTRLLDHIMVFENYPITDAIENAENEAGTAVFKVTSFEAFEQSNYDLALVVIPKSDIRISLNYNANRYDGNMMERVAANLGHVITQIIRDGSVKVKDLEVVAEQEEKTILEIFNDTATPYAEEKTMIDLFEAQVKRTPENVAVLSGGYHYTYKWLNESANRLAALLRAKGIQRETSVAVLMHRDIELIVTLFAILKAGGKYVPVEPYLPDNRIATIFKAVNAAHVITNARYRDRVNHLMQAGHIITMDLDAKQELQTMEDTLSSYPATDPEKWNLSTDLAYVIFTSGSSGEPKGVAVQHRPVINLIEWVNNTYGIGEKDLLLFVSSVGFDLSVYDLFGMLAAGGTVRVANAQDLEEPDTLARIIVEEGITFWDSAPALLQQVIPFLERRRGNALAMGKLRITFLSGDWIPLTMPVQMKDLFPALRFIALGGATEATVWSNSYEVHAMDPEWKSIPYGKPIQNAKYIILDKERNICPIGVAGDLYIGGQCLAQSYFNDEVLSSKKFIADPFHLGGTLYDTGDMARWFPDGNIEFLGRKDSQVKIRGYRIELGEIESRLIKHDSITQVLTHVMARSRYDKSICAYYVAVEEIPVETLRDFLRKDLPDYMIPRHFVHLQEIPVSRNGKVDRKKLPEPELLHTSGSLQLPQTPTELKLAGIWSALLQIDPQRINTSMNFFECGGHSVMAVHLINAIQQELGVHVKLRDIFEHTTIQEQAILIDNSEIQDATHIPRVMERTFYPVSSAQERLFYTHLLNTDSLVHNISNVFEIKGDIDLQWLKHAFRFLIERHESLRTGFILSEDGVVQKIETEIDIEPELMDPDKYQTVQEAYSDFVRPFDLSRPSLMRCGLLQNAELGNLLLVDIHHIVCDGLSLNILMNEFMDICSVKELQPLNIRYVDYAVWQQLSKQRLAKQQKFWLEQLSGEIPPLELPVMRDRAAVEIHDAAMHQLELNEEEINRFSATANVSGFMFLLSIYYLLLSKLTGNTDIVIGTDVTGRTNISLAGIVGTFINQLPLRVKLRTEATYEEFLEDVKTCVLAAYDNQDLQYDQIVALRKENGYTNNLVEVHFSMANYLDKQPVESRFGITPVDLRIKNTTPYEFKLEAVKAQNKLNLLFIYSTDLYEQSTIALFARYYQHILAAVLKNASIRIEDLKLEGFLENMMLD